MNSPARQAITSTRLILAVSLFLLISGNFTFFTHVLDTYPWNSSNAGFLLSVPVMLACEIILLTLLMSLLIPIRVTLSILLLVTAIAAYFSDAFGTIIDTVMIQNLLQTNPSESSDLITPGFLLRLSLLGLVPIALVWYFPLRPEKFLPRLRNKLFLALVAVIVFLLCGMLFSSQYASFVREHKAFRFYANPMFPLYSAGRQLARAGTGGHHSELVQLAHNVTISNTDGGNELAIMVLGETARRDRFSLNGYTRNTNPELAAETNIFSYTHITSCGTSTAVSIPCMFALSGRKNYDSDVDRSRENILDILQHAGVSILWRDNNSSSKGVADRVPFEDFQTPATNPECDPECRDVGMLHGLQEYIDAQSGDILIILHQMGSHGPAYYKRYPAGFDQFTPACQSAELAECSDEEISNAYDNTIVYTDYFLYRVIALLKANTPRYETAMLYVSDHGESLGENGIYLHGLPYWLAPEEQINVPVIVWVGETSDIDIHSVLSHEDMDNSQDAVFQTLLTIYEVETDLASTPPGLFEAHE